MERAPELIRQFTVGELNTHIVRFSWNEQWRPALSKYPKLSLLLGREIRAVGGVSRDFVKAFADKDPVELYIVSLIFGYGDYNIRWPLQVQSITPPFDRDRITKIVSAVQNQGASAGWYELMTNSKIEGLGYAFGTKLLWAAGYVRITSRRPLILDDNVSYALNYILGPEKWPYEYQKSVDDYLTYLDIAEKWASDSTWQQDESSELVEYALFKMGKALRRNSTRDAERDS